MSQRLASAQLVGKSCHIAFDLCPVTEHREAPAPRQAKIEAPLLSKTFRRDSWTSIVSSTVAFVAMADVSLRSTMEGQAELLRSELLNMASFRLEEKVQPP